MRMTELIAKKRDGIALSKEEIIYIVDQYVADKIPDYQMSAFLMAVFLKGMTDEETAILTMAMAQSGEMVDLSDIEGIKVDKHSTGGVGDKTTFVVASLVAACGGKVAKMSGRGLGHTGGTIDKMESIPGLQTELSETDFFRVVRETGMSIIGQSGNLAPADKKIYALRDVTGTIESIPLIASSIMSKKLAAGSNAILLDVKVGSGAFMKSFEDALQLAQTMVSIGEKNGRETVALLTDMDRPLGKSIGNALEMKEVIYTLRGEGPSDLTDECLEMAAQMLCLAHIGDSLMDCRLKATEVLNNGQALAHFKAMVTAQGGDSQYVDDPELLPIGEITTDIIAREDGIIYHMNAAQCGKAAVVLGAGREIKDAPIDFGAGIVMHKKTGDTIKKGDRLATLYTNNQTALEEAMHMYEGALAIGAVSAYKPSHQLILAEVNAEGVLLFGE